MEIFYYTSLKTSTPLGTVRLAATEKGLAMLGFMKDSGEMSDMPAAFMRDAGIRDADSSQSRNGRSQWIESPGKMKKYIAQIEAYISGKRKSFDFPLDLRGTEFQKKCWRALLAIPYGETRSYAEIAKAVGSKSGFRAVGQANHRNPVAIVVPCHRVITTAGTLGGYGGGLATKRWLLKLEGVDPEHMAESSKQSEPSQQLQLL